MPKFECHFSCSYFFGLRVLEFTDAKEAKEKAGDEIKRLHKADEKKKYDCKQNCKIKITGIIAINQ